MTERITNSDKMEQLANDGIYTQHELELRQQAAQQIAETLFDDEWFEDTRGYD